MGVLQKSSARVLLLAGGVVLSLTAGRAGAQETQPALSPAKLLGLIEANGGYAFAATAPSTAPRPTPNPSLFFITLFIIRYF